MKRSLLAIAVAAFAIVAVAEDAYRSNAGQPDFGNTTGVQLGDAGYRSNAGEADFGNSTGVQLGDASEYRYNAGERDDHQPQVG